MSEREKAIQLLNVIDDEKMVYIVGILENLTNLVDIPNADTIAAIKEGDEIEAIKRANKSISEQGTVPHDAIDWN